MKKVAGVFWNILYWVIISLSVLIFVLGVYQVSMGESLPMYGGIGLATVDSGSMEPNIHVGSVIVLKKQEEYSVGDIITYKNKDNILITHRIVSVSEGDVTTKGDANRVSDPVFSETDVVGKVLYIIPYIGYIVNIIQSQAVIFLFFIAVLYIVISNIVGLGRRQKSELQSVESELVGELLKEESMEKQPKSRKVKLKIKNKK